MSFKILGHTADVRMYVHAGTLEGLFQDAAAGLMFIVKSDISKSPLPPASGSVSHPARRGEGQGEGDARSAYVPVKRQVRVDALDQTALLIDFLSEILTLSQTNREVYTDIAVHALSDTHVEAELTGVRVDGFDEDIKAVTYHEAQVRKNKKGEWETMIVLDV